MIVSCRSIIHAAVKEKKDMNALKTKRNKNECKVDIICITEQH
jgi:hypothetical protein